MTSLLTYLPGTHNTTYHIKWASCTYYYYCCYCCCGECSVSYTQPAWQCLSLSNDAQFVTLGQLSTASHVQVVLAHTRVSVRLYTDVPLQTVCVLTASAQVSPSCDLPMTMEHSVKVRCIMYCTLLSVASSHFAWVAPPIRFTWLLQTFTKTFLSQQAPSWDNNSLTVYFWNVSVYYIHLYSHRIV